jgi:2-methylisocitrate lyase-like PEP mutase family enzyme
METFCRQVPGPKMANMLEEGVTPVLPPETLRDIGYRIAAYPLTLLNSAAYAMREALEDLKAGRTPQRRVDFETIRGIVGFEDYDRMLDGYSDTGESN